MAISIQRMFRERLAHEGRTDEWAEVVAEMEKELSRKLTAGDYWEVMKRLGYQGSKEERALAEERGGVAPEPRKKLTFEEALQQLPLEADTSACMLWVENHPAMARLDRSKDPSKAVLLTAEDIKDAPARSAAIALQHWVNRPGKFREQLLQEHKKRAILDGGDSEDEVEDLPLKDAIKLLNEFSKEEE